MFSLFVQLWKTETLLNSIWPKEIDVIVPISYGSKPDGLIYATEMNLRRAIELKKKFFHALMVFSPCSYLFLGSEQVEEKFRREILAETGISDFIIADSMINSVDEAEKISDALHEKGLYPKGILIVTGELHSRSALFIYKKMFPNANIYVTCIPHWHEIQPDHPVGSQRIMWKWVFSNILRQIALWLLPWTIVRRIKHQTVNSRS